MKKQFLIIKTGIYFQILKFLSNIEKEKKFFNNEKAETSFRANVTGWRNLAAGFCAPLRLTLRAAKVK